MPTVGQQFEGLRIKDILAESSLATTFLAERPGKQKVVLKIFKDETFTRKNEISHLIRPREAITQGIISNQAYLSFYKKVATTELPQIGKRAFLVRGYVAGKNMAQWRESLTSLSETTNIFRKICLGLNHLHRAGLIHGGLCPQNIIIGDGTLKITDFGTGVNFLTTVLQKADTRPDIKSYLPPWFDDLKEFNHPATDIYALGAILYFLQTGTAPKGIPDDAIPPAKKAMTGVYKDVADFMEGLEQLIKKDGQIIEPEEQIDKKQQKKELKKRGDSKSPESVPEIEIKGEDLEPVPSGLGYRLDKTLKKKKELFSFDLKKPAKDGQSLSVNLSVASGADWIRVEPAEITLATGKQQFWITLGPLEDSETKQGKIVIEIPIDDSGGRITREILVSACLEQSDFQPKGIKSKLKWAALLCAFFLVVFLAYETARYSLIYIPEIKGVWNQWFSDDSGTPTVEPAEDNLADKLSWIENDLLAQGEFLQGKYEIESLKASHPSDEKVDITLNKITESINIKTDLIVYPGRSVRPEGMVKISSGNGFQLLFRPEDAIHLYIFQIDSHDNLQQLFPNIDATDDHNPLNADTAYQIPTGDSWFILDLKSGMETIYFLASRWPALDLEKLFSRYNEAADDDQKNQYRQELVERIEVRRQAYADNMGGCFYKEFSFWHDEARSNLQKSNQETGKDVFEPSARLGDRNEAFTQQVAENFVRKYISTVSSGNIEEIIGYYGEQVDYFKVGTVDKDFILRDKANYFRRWPTVINKLNSDIRVESGDKDTIKIAKFTIQFTLYNRKWGKRISGTAMNSLTIQKTDDRLKIIDIKQNVIKRVKNDQ